MCSPSQLYKLPSKFAQAVSVPVNQHSGSKLAMMLVATIFRHYPPPYLPPLSSQLYTFLIKGVLGSKNLPVDP